MGFLIKSAFWLSLALLFIPLDISDRQEDSAPMVGPVDAFFAARGAFEDMAGMCERRPQVCETGRLAGRTISLRARESVRIAASFLEEPEEEAEEKRDGGPATPSQLAAVDERTE